MKHLKMLGLTAIAAMALMAFASAGSASATVLCTENKEPCPAGEDYAAGTTVHAVLEEGEHATLESIWTTVTCEASTVQGKTESTGGEGKTVKVPIEAISFEECGCASDPAGSAHATVLEKGSLEVQNISSTDDGTVTGKGTVITFNCTPLGTQCRFGTKAEGTDLGALNGGNPATLAESATVSWSSATNDEGSFLCSTTAEWEAAYEVTSPKPLHVVGG